MRSRHRTLSINRSAAERTLAGLALLLTLLLASCNNEWLYARDRRIQANTQPPGPGYKADIVAFMRTYLNDPVGVRGAFISEPALRSLEGADVYTLCLRYTPRGGATKDNLAIFREGRFDRVIDAAREACKDAAYQPFPELERISR